MFTNEWDKDDSYIRADFFSINELLSNFFSYATGVLSLAMLSELVVFLDTMNSLAVLQGLRFFHIVLQSPGDSVSAILVTTQTLDLSLGNYGLWLSSLLGRVFSRTAALTSEMHGCKAFPCL